MRAQADASLWADRGAEEIGITFQAAPSPFVRAQTVERGAGGPQGSENASFSLPATVRTHTHTHQASSPGGVGGIS